jgi:hypothetical protein
MVGAVMSEKRGNLTSTDTVVVLSLDGRDEQNVPGSILTAVT